MIRAFAAHRTGANLLMLAVIVLGLVALPRLQRDTFPEIPATEVEIRIPYPGAAAADVERGVCALVEQPLRAIAELAELRCDARENLAIITAILVPLGVFFSRFAIRRAKRDGSLIHY